MPADESCGDMTQPITAQIRYNVAEPNTQGSQARLCGLCSCTNRNMPAIVYFHVSLYTHQESEYETFNSSSMI